MLPDLLEAGKLYRGMTKSKLAALVEGLQPQVDQLAEVLSLELTEERDYVQMLVDAQRQMAALGEADRRRIGDLGERRSRRTPNCSRTRTSFPTPCEAFLAGGSKPAKTGERVGAVSTPRTTTQQRDARDRRHDVGRAARIGRRCCESWWPRRIVAASGGRS